MWHQADFRWSYGVVLYEIFSYGTVPYPSISSEAVLEFVKKGNRLEVPPDTPTWLYESLVVDMNNWLQGTIDGIMLGRETIRPSDGFRSKGIFVCKYRECH